MTETPDIKQRSSSPSSWILRSGPVGATAVWALSGALLDNSTMLRSADQDEGRERGKHSGGLHRKVENVRFRMRVPGSRRHSSAGPLQALHQRSKPVRQLAVRWPRIQEPWCGFTSSAGTAGHSDHPCSLGHSVVPRRPLPELRAAAAGPAEGDACTESARHHPCG